MDKDRADTYDSVLEKLLCAVQALELIAAPIRSDGTYNRDRKACELLAKAALDEIRKGL